MEGKGKEKFFKFDKEEFLKIKKTIEEKYGTFKLNKSASLRENAPKNLTEEEIIDNVFDTIFMQKNSNSGKTIMYSADMWINIYSFEGNVCGYELLYCGNIEETYCFNTLFEGLLFGRKCESGDKLEEKHTLGLKKDYEKAFKKCRKKYQEEYDYRGFAKDYICYYCKGINHNQGFSLFSDYDGEKILIEGNPLHYVIKRIEKPYEQVFKCCKGISVKYNKEIIEYCVDTKVCSIYKEIKINKKQVNYFEKKYKLEDIIEKKDYEKLNKIK